ncbi:MAG: YfhO family protein [Lachnospiraceae bacterium]|jgi:uncharacterized membrane protein YfhO|nr:YfhO family protein [Lachnospiraceae bacterium]
MKTSLKKTASRPAVQDAAAFLTAFLCLLLLAVLLHIAPFGDSTFLYNDMKRQYVDFYSYYRQVFFTSNDLLYSFSKGLGGGMPGFFAYYLTSPLLLPFIFVPRTLLPSAVTWLLITKQALAAATVNFFLRRHAAGSASGISLLCTIPFSAAFALSAWMSANAANSMWIDAVVLFPLLLDAALRFSGSSRKAFLRTVLLTAATVYVNYYIACMVLLFTGLCMLLRLLFLRTVSLRRFAAWCASTVLGGGLTAAVMLPAYLELRASNKNVSGNTFRALFTGAAFRDPRPMLSRLFSLSFDASQVMDGQPHLFCGTAVLLFACLYFCSRRIPRRERAAAGILLAFLFLSFCFVPLDLLWHGGTAPLGYPYRYAFLFVFLLVCCACRAAFTASLNPEPRLLPVLLLLAAALLYPAPWLPTVRKVWNLVLAAAFSGGLLLLRRALTGGFARCSRRRAAAVALTALLLLHALDLCANSALVYRNESIRMTGRKAFIASVTQLGSLVDKVKTADSGFYRIASLMPREQNDSMQFAYNGIVHYGSEDRYSTRLFLQHLGFDYNGLYTDYDGSDTKTADSILGIKYILQNGDVKTNGNAFPIAVTSFASADTIARSADSSLSSDDDPFRFQQKIADMLTNADMPSSAEETLAKDGALFTPAFISTQEVTQDTASRTVTENISASAAASGLVYFYLDGLRDRAQDMTVTCGEREVGGYGNASNIKVLCLGRFSKGDPISLRIDAHGSDMKSADFGSVSLVTENTDVLEEDAEILKDRAGRITKLSSSHLKIEVPADSGSLILAIPFEKGWVAEINGKRIKNIQAAGAWICLSLPAETPSGSGTATVDLRFVPPGLSAGAAVSAVCATLVCLLCFLLRKHRLRHS